MAAVYPTVCTSVLTATIRPPSQLGPVSYTHLDVYKRQALAYVFFSLGMIGSPLPVWIMRDSFLAQISQQGMPEAYVSTLAALTSPGTVSYTHLDVYKRQLWHCP